MENPHPSAEGSNIDSLQPSNGRTAAQNSSAGGDVASSSDVSRRGGRGEGPEGDGFEVLPSHPDTKDVPPITPTEDQPKDRDEQLTTMWNEVRESSGDYTLASPPNNKTVNLVPL